MDKLKSIRNILIIGLSIGIIIGTFVLYISRDVSLDYNVWISVGKKSGYQVGDYVRFQYNHPDKYIEGKWLIKQITCGPGDILLREGDTITCNNKVIAKVLDKTRNGDKLVPLEFTGKIPEGYYFLQGTHERSYDSRYWGLIGINEISKKVIPLRSILLW